MNLKICSEIFRMTGTTSISHEDIIELEKAKKKLRKKKQPVIIQDEDTYNWFFSSVNHPAAFAWSRRSYNDSESGILA